MMLERIEISVIPNDSKHEETILQITDCLDNLHLAASHIFQCIDNRIADYGKRLSTIKEKTNKIENQLSYLQNNMSLKAIKMYSDAKYPAYSTYQEYKTTIDANIPERSADASERLFFESLAQRKIKSSESSQSRTNINYYSPDLNLKEKLQFYYVMGTSLKKKPTDSPQKLNTERVSSVSALLMNEPSGESREQYRAQNSGGGQEIQDAPDSIGQPWRSADFESPSYLYAPTLGEVPQINVPAILPDLPGIVDDEKFVLDLTAQSPIAPSSAVTSPTLRIDLPDTAITPETPEIKPPTVEINAPNLPNIGDSEPIQEPVLPPPPPPPPAPPEPPLPPPSTAQVAPTASTSLPPPPPPPPIPELSEAPAPKAPVKVATPAGGDDRTNLMAAIRAAGGVGKAKLRHATPVIEDPKDRFASASVGGDLMADLHAKLALRRKGIAGGAMGALERISRLIPPPPKPNEASDRNSATSEYDSQPDVDEWEE